MRTKLNEKRNPYPFVAEKFNPFCHRNGIDEKATSTSDCKVFPIDTATHKANREIIVDVTARKLRSQMKSIWRTKHTCK
jgi:hypothetical protein